MDKKVFLLDKERYSEETANSFSEKELEKWVSRPTYEDDLSIIKIDANDYDSVETALENEISNIDDYYVRSFGF